MAMTLAERKKQSEIFMIDFNQLDDDDRTTIIRLVTRMLTRDVDRDETRAADRRLGDVK